MAKWEGKGERGEGARHGKGKGMEVNEWVKGMGTGLKSSLYN